MIDVIIITLNRQVETIKTLEALFKNNKDINVIIIDNGSDDLGYLDKFDVKIIKNKENIGVTRAYNQGLEISNLDYIVLMHNDIVINTIDWINKATDFMEKNSKAGMIGQAGWKLLTIDAVHSGEFRTSIEHYKSKPRGFEEVVFLDGCCNVIKNIGLRLDEFLDYYYDYDLSMEYRNLGYKLYVMDGSSIHLSDHEGKFEKTIELPNCNIKMDRKTSKNYFLNKWEGYLPVWTK